MKRKILLTALTAFLLASHSFAQIPGVSKVTKKIPKFTLGVKVGANLQELSTPSSFKSVYNPGFVGGIFAGLHTKKIGVKVEGLIKTAKFSTSNGNISVNALYLDVPVLFEYNVIPHLWIQVGPQFSDMMSAKSDNAIVQNSFKNTDFSGVLGFEARLPFHLSAGARYILGLTDINNHDTGAPDAWHNRSVQVFVGFRFL